MTEQTLSLTEKGGSEGKDKDRKGEHTRSRDQSWASLMEKLKKRELR